MESTDNELLLPILPLRNSVLFPASVVPVNVGRARSVRLIEEACGTDRPTIGVVAQRRPETEDPTLEDVHPMGTIARVLKVIRLSSGNYSVVLQGVARMEIVEPLERTPCLRAKVTRVHEVPSTDEEVQALAAHLRLRALELQELLPNPTRETSILDNVQDPAALADLIASSLPVGNDAKQEILQTLDVRERLRKVVALVNRQCKVHRVKKEISTMVREEMSKSQREFLLRQQLKTIRRELGEDEVDEDEVEQLRERVSLTNMPLESEKAAKGQLRRMRTMNPASAEYQVARNYVEWICDLPWDKTSVARMDVHEARRVLDEDHHGLEEAKRRIIEYIAVRKLKSDIRGPILCLVGPPGVGKTSLARSIARATGREFVRVALGGVGDEAEIRGHRRTYVGAFPGRLVSGLKKAGTRNPIMLLDEIDKMGSNSKGDPSGALLEVLDPEQNKDFRDHYIEVPVDLSKTLFIATANRLDTISGPLLDRMEVIRLPGYTRDEKNRIARDFLIPRQLEEHGLPPDRLEFTEEGRLALVDDYTREAGVRTLEKKVASVCRAVAVRLAKGEDVHVLADKMFIEDVLGAPRYSRPKPDKKPQPGFSTGLAWTPVGGELLFVEARRMPGTGKIRLTGQVGDVMKESVAAAFTYIRARAGQLGLPEDFLSKIDIHIHLPQGSVKKDGAFAGITIFTALASMLTRLKVRSDVATCGEMTLRGNVLKVGGIKEMCLAAHHAGIKRIVLPKRNEPDLEDVPKAVLKDLDIRLVQRIDEVLPLVIDEPMTATA